jgi:CheY-like chemotaxis protein
MTQRCILQVEDEETDVLLLQHAFRKAEIANRVHVATDAGGAVAYLSGTGQFADRKEYPVPCLVLLDLKLPDRNGLEVLQWLRSQPVLKAMVVIALTSSDHLVDIQRAYELGVNSYVIKPRDNQRRVELALHLKDWWLGCNQFAS